MLAKNAHLSIIFGAISAMGFGALTGWYIAQTLTLEEVHTPTFIFDKVAITKKEDGTRYFSIRGRESYPNCELVVWQEWIGSDDKIYSTIRFGDTEKLLEDTKVIELPVLAPSTARVGRAVVRFLCPGPQPIPDLPTPWLNLTKGDEDENSKQ